MQTEINKMVHLRDNGTTNRLTKHHKIKRIIIADRYKMPLVITFLVFEELSQDSIYAVCEYGCDKNGKCVNLRACDKIDGSM